MHGIHIGGLYLPYNCFLQCKFVKYLHLFVLSDINTRFFIDTWQYFLHRFFHTNRYLYKHIHSVHHRLYVPYAFGALYNHPLEGFLLDTVGAVLAHSLAMMTTRQAIVLFAISTLKTVDDHCGYRLPLDPLQLFFGNNADYHDIHHQVFSGHSLCCLFLINCFSGCWHQAQLLSTFFRTLGCDLRYSYDSLRFREAKK